MHEIADLEWRDIKPAEDLLLYAFKKYPMHKWIFETEKNPEPILRALNKSCINYSIRYGKAFKTPNLEAILLAKNPEDVKNNFWHNARGDVKIAFYG